MQDEVLEFIKRRWSSNSNWLDGNCYWFALILKKRFPRSRLYYLPKKGHFITKINGTFYDWTGIVEPSEKPMSITSIKKLDSSWHDRIIRDCFY